MVSRSVPTWIGATPDAKIPPRVRLRQFERDEGRCCECTRKLYPGDRWETDHIRALINGGENIESNLQTLCHDCHKTKTRTDVALKAHVAKSKKRQLGLTKKKSRWPGGRGSKWKIRIDRTVVRR